MRKVGAGRIDGDPSAAWIDYQVHVLHGHGPQQYLVAEHECPDEAEALSAGDPDRPDVGHAQAPAVRHRHVPHRLRLQIELAGDRLGNAQHERPGIGHRGHGDGRPVLLPRVGELYLCKDVPHHGSLALCRRFPERILPPSTPFR